MADPVSLARAYLDAVRTGASPAEPRAALAALDEDDLAAALDDDATRLAFWLHVYNASVQDILSRNPDRLDSRRRFFGAERLTVAGTDLSLDDVEHGLLRRSQLSVDGGYIPRLRVDAFERRFRVADPDPRLHFALNCGAVSCPRVAAYAPDAVDETLDRVRRAYLEDTVAYEPGGCSGTGSPPSPSRSSGTAATSVGRRGYWRSPGGTTRCPGGPPAALLPAVRLVAAPRQVRRRVRGVS